MGCPLTKQTIKQEDFDVFKGKNVDFIFRPHETKNEYIEIENHVKVYNGKTEYSPSFSIISLEDKLSISGTSSLKNVGVLFDKKSIIDKEIKLSDIIFKEGKIELEYETENFFGSQRDFVKLCKTYMKIGDFDFMFESDQIPVKNEKISNFFVRNYITTCSENDTD